MTEKIKENLLFSATLLTFALTAVSYAVVVLYQQSYYSFFNIDSGLLSLRIDASWIVFSSFILVGVLAAALSASALVKFIYKIFTVMTNAKLPWVDVFAFGFIVTNAVLLMTNSTPYTEILTRNPPDFFDVIEKIAQVGFLCLGLLVAVLRIYTVRRAWIEGNKKTSPIRLYVSDIKTRRPVNFDFETKWFPVIALVAILLYYTPSMAIELGKKNASNIKEFTYVLNEETVNSSLKPLVVGQSNDGYIIKVYDVKNKKFKDEFSTLKSDNLTFGKFVIDSE